MNYHWDWSILFKDPYSGWLLSGLSWTLALSTMGWVIALPLGTLIGIARTSTSPWILRTAGFYISIFRNIPLLLQMFVWFFVIPELLPNKLGLWFKRDLPNPEFWTAVLALGFYTSGRLGELFRAGLQAVPRGQKMAADATGMSRAQALRYVIMPQALRIILPPLTSEFLSIVKNSSLALTIGVLELTAQSRRIENFTFHGFEAFGAATAFYVLVALALNLVIVRFQRTLASVANGLTPMLDYSFIARNADFLFEGLLLSLVLTFTGVVGGLAVGTTLALVRFFGGTIGNHVVDIYVFMFRAIPLILVIFWFYFMVPLLLGRPVGAWTSAIVAFTLFEGAYYSEIVRAGLRSIRVGQLSAALASGLSRPQALRYVIFPQAFAVMIPVFFTQAIILFQDTSLVFVVSLHDFLTATTIVADRDGRLIEAYSFACLVYYLICLAATVGVERLKRRFAR